MVVRQKEGYIMLEINKINHGDSFELVTSLEDGIIDAYITDPPYFLGENGYKNATWDRLDIPEDTDLTDKEKEEIKKEYFQKLIRLIEPKMKPDGVMIIFNTPQNILYMSEELEKIKMTKEMALENNSKYDFSKGLPSKWYIDNDIQWIKKGVRPGIDPINESEHALIAFNREVKSEKFNKRSDYSRENTSLLISSYVDVSPKKHSRMPYGVGTEHFTPKPNRMWKDIIRKYTNTNDLVLDTYSGSGITALVCVDLSRNFISIEREKEQYERSNERLEDFIQNCPKSLFLNSNLIEGLSI